MLKLDTVARMDTTNETTTLTQEPELRPPAVAIALLKIAPASEY